MKYGQQINNDHYFVWSYVRLTNKEKLFGHLPIESKTVLFMFVNIAINQEDYCWTYIS